MRRQRAAIDQPSARRAVVLRRGYWYIRIEGKGDLGHRLAWLYMHGHFPDGLLDHKKKLIKLPDRGPAKSDAEPKRRKCKPACNSTSGFKGVYWHKKHNKYRA